MKRKGSASDYFAFSRKDRIAVFTFLIIVGVLAISPHFFPSRPSTIGPIPDSLLSHRDTADGATDDRPADYAFGASGYEGSTSYTPKAAPFPFDPNTLDAAGWGRLGLPDRVVRTILKYRDKGGRFRRPEDLQKIWSLPPGFFDRVHNYIRIPEASSPRFASQEFPDHRSPFTRKERVIAPVSINEADSASLEALPGIGAKLASRIIRFRERLGGFYRVEQVAETWGLPDSTFQKIRPFLILNGAKEPVRKFNLNAVTKEELKGHPYLRWNLINAVVEYRSRHGAFTSVDELKKIMIVTDSVYERVAPYFIVK